MPTGADLAHRLQAALQVQGHQRWADLTLEPLRDKGLAHDHIRIAGSGLLARIPKQSQLGLEAEANLGYQRACFERAAASGHTPRLTGYLPPSIFLPRGALLVQEIQGRPAVLPDDLPGIAVALASLHAVELPAAAQMPPLQHSADPLLALAEEIGAQAAYLSDARLEGVVLDLIDKEMSRLTSQCGAPGRPARSLIAFDAHPGNFLIEPGGRAVLVDLEKCRYSYPGLDLAHASLYTSTTWDIASRAALTPQEVACFYAAWTEAAGPLADLARPWHAPLRRAMWLWSVTWCAKWRVLSGSAAHDSADGEDWSEARSDASLVEHVRDRVDHYLNAGVVARIIDEFDVFEAAMAG